MRYWGWYILQLLIAFLAGSLLIYLGIKNGYIIGGFGFIAAFMLTVVPLKTYYWWRYGRHVGQPLFDLSVSKWTDEEKHRRRWRKEIPDD